MTQRGSCLINRMQNTVRCMRFGKGTDCAAVAMLVNEAPSVSLNVSGVTLSHSPCKQGLRCATVRGLRCRILRFSKCATHSLLGTCRDCRQASPAPAHSSSSAMPLKCVQNVVLHCLVEICMGFPGKDVVLKAAYVAPKSLCTFRH